MNDTGSSIEPAAEPASEPTSEPTSEPASEPEDMDNDGFDTTEDCDDDNPNINPNEEEIVYDGNDNDCNPQTLDDDLDEDGFILDEDCDDTNNEIAPDLEDDQCDGIDNNCNELIDDDWADDNYEPNDEEAYWIGDPGGQEIIYNPYLFPESDLDNFVFYAEEGWLSEIGIYVKVSGLDPALDLVLDLVYHGEQINSQSQNVASSNTGSIGEDEEIEYTGGWFSSNSGWYEVRIRSRNGESCFRSYTLTIDPDH